MFLYQFIRDNGGFDNQSVILVEPLLDCKDEETLLKCERKWIENKKAELNTNIPSNTLQEYLHIHKDEKKNQDKERYQQQRDVIIEQHRVYRDSNKEAIKIYDKSIEI